MSYGLPELFLVVDGYSSGFFTGTEAALSKITDGIAKGSGLVDLTGYVTQEDLQDVVDRMTALAKFIGELPAGVRPRAETLTKMSTKQEDSGTSPHLKKVLAECR